MYYTLPDVLNATIQVGVGSQSARGSLPTDGTTSSGAAYEVTYSVEDTAPFYEAGSRIDDQGGWTGGNWLGSSAATNATVLNSHCGLGFTWRRWSGGALLGGTAEHCINPRDNPITCNWLGVSYPTLYHDQRTLGTAIATDPGSDSALLAPAAGTSFNATAWVGTPGTNVERNVTGAREIDMMYDVVVLSGPRNGLPLTETYVYGVRATTCAGPKTVTYHHRSQGGDSGAPWLTTFGNGTVRAHGQHVGGLGYNGQTRSMYTPVSRISVRLEASIAVVS